MDHGAQLDKCLVFWRPNKELRNAYCVHNERETASEASFMPRTSINGS
jgi:hypothetical protein